MKRIALLLILAATAVAGREIGEFRLKRDPTSPMRGWIIETNDQGFRFEYFGESRRTFVKWDDLVAEDASQLRQHFGLEMTRDQRLGLMPGHEMHFRGGGSLRGVLIEHDIETKRYLFRSRGLILPYPEERVERIDEVKVKEDEVFDEQEIYLRRLESRPPSTAREHTDLAARMYDIGNFRKSYEHYENAIEMQPSLRLEVEARLAELKDLLEDEEATATFRKAKYEANYNGRFEKAFRMISEHVEENPGSKRRGLMILDELKNKRLEQLSARYHRAKSEESARTIRKYVATRAPSLAEARSWITSGEYEKLVLAGVQERLGLTDEEFELMLQSKPSGAPHWATYWSGSFVLSPRAKIGKSSARAIKGDPEGWWGRYDVTTRSGWLRAYAAEKVPSLFEIVTVRESDCDKCGGTGRVKRSSMRGLESLGGAHEWHETCPRCFGARRDRAVGYR